MPSDLKEEVLERTDIVEIVGERVKLTRKGRNYTGLCPFHADHNPSLTVTPEKRLFKCWSCGAGGDVIKFVELFERVNFRQALEILAKRAGLEVHRSPVDRQRAAQRDEIRRVLDWARGHFDWNLRQTAAGAAALDYAHRRGLTDETIQRFGLGLALDHWTDLGDAADRAQLEQARVIEAGLAVQGDSGRTFDRFRNRLVFPIRDALGRVVGFGGRTLGDDPAKYLNSPETALFSKSRLLYAFDLARETIRKERRAIVVEGYMDAILLHQAGFTSVVASLGTAMTDAHVKLLKPLADEVLLCFDGDAAGIKAADRGVETAIRQSFDVRVVLLEGDADPADYVTQRGPAAFSEALANAQDALQFKWNQTARALGTTDRRARRAAVEDFVRSVATASTAGGLDPVDQGLLVERLSGVLALPATEVYGLLAHARQELRAARATEVNLDADPQTAYAEGLRGLPPALVSAVEELLGLLLTEPRHLADLNDAFTVAVAQCATWQKLFAVIGATADELGDFTREDVLQRCDDADVFELVRAALARVPGAAPTAAEFAAVYARLQSELAAQRVGELRTQVRHEDHVTADEAFAALVRTAQERQRLTRLVAGPGGAPERAAPV